MGNMITKYNLFESKKEEIKINANDYLNTWECLLNDRYRNVETGELKRLHEIFDNKTVGVFDIKGHFKVVNTHPYKPATYKRICFKDSTMDHIRIFAGEEYIKGDNGTKHGKGKSRLHIKGDNGTKHGKGKSRLHRNYDNVEIRLNSFTTCDVMAYVFYFRQKFDGKAIEIIDHRLGRAEIKKIRFDDNNFLTNIYYPGRLELTDCTYGNLDRRHYIINIFEDVVATTIINKRPDLDPFGEEDWGDSFYFD